LIKIKRFILNLLKLWNRVVRAILLRSPGKIKLVRFGSKKSHTFFGYYDVTPFSSDDQMILVGKVPVNIKKNGKSKMELGFYLLKNPEIFHKFAETETWCWQQGARLRWLPGSNTHVFYNCLIEDRYCSIVQEIESGSITKKYDYPFYDISPNGKWGLSLNFSRLQRLRPGYGYDNLPDPTIEDNVPEEDGIFLVDLSTNSIVLNIPLKQMLDFPHKQMRSESQHYFNHLSFSPGSTKFLFFHLWQNSNRRYSRLFIYNLKNSQLELVENDLGVSHFTWKNDQEILCTATLPDGKIGYFEYNLIANSKRQIGQNILISDGHPTYLKVGDSIISDTYPDKYQDRTIFQFDKIEKKKELLTVFSPFQYQGEFRCDLHPRLSNKLDKIAFDSAHNGVRSLYVMDLK